LDTASHFVIGLGLAGLAHVDPVVASDPSTMTAVLIGTVVGSQIPDSDGLFRLKGNATYIRMHRGISHSLPFLVLWTALLTFGLSLFFRDLPLGHVALWIGIAVCFHVFTDLFNTYGTQAFWPFSKKWISWNIIHIFDPFIFIAHIAAILLWGMQWAEPTVIFPTLYLLIGFYYVWRTILHTVLERRLPRQDENFHPGDRYFLIPTIHPRIWNIVKRNKDGSYTIGELRYGELAWVDHAKCAVHRAVDVSRQHTDIRSLLYFTSFACAEMKRHTWGYEVRWADVRYRHRKHYPFVAVLLLDLEMKPIDSYVGWLSEAKLEKKLRIRIQ